MNNERTRDNSKDATARRKKFLRNYWLVFVAATLVIALIFWLWLKLPWWVILIMILCDLLGMVGAALFYKFLKRMDR